MLQNEEIEEDRHDRKRKYQTRSCERSLQSDHSNHQQLKHRCSYDHPIKRKTVKVFKLDCRIGVLGSKNEEKSNMQVTEQKPARDSNFNFLRFFFWRHYIYMNRARNLLT